MSSARPNGFEVVTSVQRRRRWTSEEKLALEGALGRKTLESEILKEVVDQTMPKLSKPLLLCKGAPPMDTEGFGRGSDTMVILASTASVCIA